jgi:hypothetical protein
MELSKRSLTPNRVQVYLPPSFLDSTLQTLQGVDAIKMIYGKTRG